MLAKAYQKCSHWIVGLILCSSPLLAVLTLSLHPVNDVETWLPESDPSRARYEEFKREFGNEEFVLISFDGRRAAAPDAELIEALCVRLERLPEIRQCWSPGRMQAIMVELGVDRQTAEQRLHRLLVSPDGNMSGVVAVLSDAGFRDRSNSVNRIREELRYCLLDGAGTLLAGAPIFVAELDRLGSKEANTNYFLVTLGICVAILYFLIRDWKLTGLVFCLTTWTINVTTLALHSIGVEINLLLSSIPVLVMVLTMSICVHYLYYHGEALERNSGNPITAALKSAWQPTLIATVTTCIGELALSISDIAPIRHFAYAASLGSVASMLVGLCITPALVVVCPLPPRRTAFPAFNFKPLSEWIVHHSRGIAVATLAVTAVSCAGIFRLESSMDVVDYLPHNSKVRQDFLDIQRDLTPVDNLEAVVRFDADLPFVAKLDRVRRIEAEIRRHPAVVQTLSLAGFFPDPLPQDPLKLLAVLQNATRHQSHAEFSADDNTVWRITARLRVKDGKAWRAICDELETSLRGEPVVFTSLSSLVVGAQTEIFNSFWQSILVALVLITGTIMIFLRSVRAGITAMIPNLAPLCWIYGMLGWLGWPIDIAMMLSGSIALGLSVDGTFHFMSHFRTQLQKTGSADEAVREALLESSIPFSQATLTAMAGMLGLTLSSFAPTARFGWLMIALMLAALVGDVVMLPALVRVVCGSKERRPQAAPESVSTPAALKRAA